MTQHIGVQTSRASRARRGLATAIATFLTAGGVVALASPSQAATTEVDDATLSWGLSNEQGGGAFFGGCNFLSAGKAGNTGSSRLWAESDGFYKSADGNVRVEKPNATGTYGSPSWATKCQDKNGTAVNAGSTTSLTGNRVKLYAGTGSFDAATGAGTISWTGSFTSAFYGGLTYWSATDPTLTVDAAGNGTLTATASGYGTDRDDPTLWDTITPRTITLAELTDVDITASGFTATPEYVGVAVTTSPTAQAQAAKTSANEAFWGSFPQDFVDFQTLTGQTSYWYASGGSRDAAKPAGPVALTFENTPAVTIGSKVTVSSPRLTYGRGGSVTVSVAATGATPTGTVTLSGLGAARSATLSGGRATFALPTSLAARSYAATVTYAGAANVTGSTGRGTVTVGKATTARPTVRVSKRPTSKKKGKATITVKSSVSSLKPGGKVTVTLTKGTSTKRVKATVKNGKVSVSLPKLKKGTWKLKVTYAGSATQGSATSRTYKVKSAA